LGWIQVQSKEKEVKEVRDRSAKMNAELHKYKLSRDQDVNEMKEKVSRSHAESLQWKEKCQDQEKEILLLRDLLNVTEMKLQKMTKSNQKLEAACEENSSRFRCLEKKLKIADMATAKKLQGLKLEHKAEIRAFKDELSTKTSMCENMQADMTQSIKSINLIHREDLNRLRQELHQVRQQAQRFESEHENSRMELEKSRAHFEDEVKELNQDMRECRGKAKSFRSESSQYQNVIKAKDEIIKKNLKQIERMNCQIQELTDEIHSVNDNFRETSKENQDLKISNTKMKTTLEFKEKELQRLEK